MTPGWEIPGVRKDWDNSIMTQEDSPEYDPDLDDSVAYLRGYAEGSKRAGQELAILLTNKSEPPTTWRSEPKSSVEMTSPTASQRGGGLPQVTAKLYFDNGEPGARQQALADLYETFEDELAWRPEAGT